MRACETTTPRAVRLALIALLLLTFTAVRATPALAVPPANDDILSATLIDSQFFSETIDTSEATTAVDDPGDCGTGPTVWYAFTPLVDADVVIDTGLSGYVTLVSVYTGSPGALSGIACGFHGASFTAAAGETYRIMVGADLGGVGGIMEFSLFAEEIVTPPPPPANDDFDFATVVGSVPYVDGPVAVAGATVGFDDPWCFGGEATVWYAFTPTDFMHLEATTFGSDYASTLSVYTGSRGALTQIACSTDFVGFDATAGVTYYILVGAVSGWPPTTLFFTLDGFVVPPPPTPAPNDDLANATVIGALPYTDVVDTSASTTNGDPGSCFSPGATVWYRFTPDHDMLVSASTAGSNFETSIDVYTADLVHLDNGCGSTQVSFNAVAGQTYLFMVGAIFDGFGGQLVFTVTDEGPPLAIEMTIDPVGRVVSATGVATISGTLTCTRPIQIGLSGELRQKIGRKTIISGGFAIPGMTGTPVSCDGVNPASWSAQVRSDEGAFSGGQSDATAFAQACDPVTGLCAFDNASATVRLKGGRS